MKRRHSMDGNVLTAMKQEGSSMMSCPAETSLIPFHYSEITLTTPKIESNKEGQSNASEIITINFN